MKMTQRTPYILLLFLSLAMLQACVKEGDVSYSGPGKRPIYLSVAELQQIRNLDPKPIQSSGTIFLKDTLLFVMEQGRGIHVFSLKDTANTVNLTFFSIPAISDFTLVGDYLYAASWKDLVVIDILDLRHIAEVNRISNAVEPPLYPLLYDGHFECVDERKGAVVGWEDANLEEAYCNTL
jgi:hypothetical protein